MLTVIRDQQQLVDYLRRRDRGELHHSRLGELLLADGRLDAHGLEEALEQQRVAGNGAHLGQILVDRHLLEPKALDDALLEQLAIARVDLDAFPFDARLLASIPEQLAREKRVLPLFEQGSRLVVALPASYPVTTDCELLHLLGFVTGKQIEPLLAADEQLEMAIHRHYGSASVLQLPEDESSAEEVSLARIKQMAEDKPTVRFLDALFEEAIARRASDIHLRPDSREVAILLRIDGALTQVRSIKPGNLAALVSRIKIVGGMNIAERRLPQDGRHLMRVGGHSVDLRLSVMPTVHGESVVVRILDTGQSLKTLDQLGFSAGDALRFRQLSGRNQGILLVTGPTGSGKSTTLYAALNDIRASGVNVITVEDPVEFQIEGIRQVQVKPQIGYTFARALRHILRHDPDVIMVGEIRDHETAQMAVESALTGHLVLSTLHTNGAASTITRLLEIGIAPYLLNASLLGVLAQRLVRRNCPHCLAEEQVPDYVRSTLGLGAEERFYVGRGCAECHGKGFAGRVAAYELLEVTPALRELIRPQASAQDIERQAVADGMSPLTDSALALARQKLIPLAEVYRVRL